MHPNIQQVQMNTTRIQWFGCVILIGWSPTKWVLVSLCPSSVCGRSPYFNTHPFGSSRNHADILLEANLIRTVVEFKHVQAHCFQALFWPGIGLPMLRFTHTHKTTTHVTTASMILMQLDNWLVQLCCRMVKMEGTIPHKSKQLGGFGRDLSRESIFSSKTVVVLF